MRLIVTALVISGIAVLMAMTGRGGGNFYVPVLVAAGEPMHKAATTGQCVLFATACAAMLVFHKHKKVDRKLALVIDPPTDIMAFVGGYFAHLVSGPALKFLLAALLVAASFCMLLNVNNSPAAGGKRFGFWPSALGIAILCLAVAGGLLGGKLSLKTAPKKLKMLFALSTLAAAIFMACNALFSA